MEENQRSEDLASAKELLSDTSFTLVLVRNQTVYKSQKRGIAPMMNFLDSGADLSGFCAADRIVGRAAAMLFLLGGIRGVHAEVITHEAIEILNRAGVTCTYDLAVDQIINREGSGPCPMERATKGVSDPVSAYQKIRQTLEMIRKNNF